MDMRYGRAKNETVFVYFILCLCLIQHLHLFIFQILSRIGSALRFMIEIAARETDSSCLAAITHSSYLRLLIGAVDDFRFFSSATPQNNCGINVIDFPRPKKFFPSNHDANPNENVADNFVPLGKIIRVNERRHLSSIQSDQESSVRSLIKSF